MYVSNKNESVRMFESNFMEFLSHVHPVTLLVLYSPVIGYLMFISFAHRKLLLLAVTALFIAGIIIKTTGPGMG